MGTPLDPARDHRISIDDAAAQTRAHRHGAPISKGDSGAFNAAPVRELLDQRDCVGVRYYKGLNADGDATMILVGVDANGNDITSGIVLDIVFLCPPVCPDGNLLNT